MLKLILDFPTYMCVRVSVCVTAPQVELWDLDKRSADDLMCTLWFHTDYLPLDLFDSERPALTLDRTEIDGPHLTAHDQNCKRFDEGFRCPHLSIPAHQCSQTCALLPS
jgi:hypothetical protein